MNLALGAAVHSAIEWYLNRRIDGEEPEGDEVDRSFQAAWTAETTEPLLVFEGNPPKTMERLGADLVTLFIGRFASEEPPVQAEARFEVDLVAPHRVPGWTRRRSARWTSVACSGR